MSIYSKLSSLLTAANNKTGESDTTLTDAVQTLIDGYGQGGGTPNNISVSIQNARASGAIAAQSPQYDSTLGTICALNYTINLGNTGTITTIDQNGAISFRAGFNVSSITYNGNDVSWTEHVVSSASLLKIVLPTNYDSSIPFVIS